MFLRDIVVADPPAELQLRLQHIWRLCNPPEPEQHCALGTLWTDDDEHRIEEYTEPDDVEEVTRLIAEGSIYKIHNPYLIRARSAMRSCPGDFSISIRSENLLHKVEEDPERPFFPAFAFSIVTTKMLRAAPPGQTASSDVIGRLTAVTRPVPSIEVRMNFTFVVDHPSCERLVVHYINFQPAVSFDLQQIATIEQLTPIICMLTCLTVTDQTADGIILQSTGASRIATIGSDQSELEVQYPTEFLNGLSFNGMLEHELVFK